MLFFFELSEGDPYLTVMGGSDRTMSRFKREWLCIDECGAARRGIARVADREVSFQLAHCFFRKGLK